MSSPAASRLRPVTGAPRCQRPPPRVGLSSGLPLHYPPRRDRSRVVRIPAVPAPAAVTGASRETPARTARATSKLREWGRRYLAAEIVGTLCALAAALGVYAGSRSLASAALAASLAETAGFYSMILRQTLPPIYRLHAGLSTGRRLWMTCRHGLAEASDFVVAEVCDTLVLRPTLIYLAASWAGSDVVAGLLVGKVLADAGFYAVVIPSYELRKRLARA
jgi:hypothetical protein